MRHTDVTVTKVLHFIGASRADMIALPDQVRAEFGHGLWQVQGGETPDTSSPFEGSHL